MRYLHLLKREFQGYNAKSLTADLLSGITVAAVALPLALAFGVSSGADAAAGREDTADTARVPADRAGSRRGRSAGPR